MAMRKQLGGRKSNKKKSKRVNRSHKKRKGGGMFKGRVALSPSYSIDVNSKLLPGQSALASPPPIKIENNCLNTWKHLGSEKMPYNKIWN